jgi:predicted dehydrogenase
MNKKICVTGAGRWGINHIKTLMKLDALGAVVESSEERIAELRKDFSDIAFYSDLDEAIEADYDGYVIATPAETHYPVGKKLLENKKNVLIEKPMTLKDSESEELLQLADTNGVSLMVGHVLLFHPAIQKIKEVIDGGRIGTLQYIYSNRLNLGTVRTEENVFWSFAPHDISIFDYFIGSPPVNIESSGGAFLQGGIHDTTMTTLSYAGNIKAHIFVSWLHPYKEHKIIIVGSKGMISFEDSSPEKEIVLYDKGINFESGVPVKRDEGMEVIEYEKDFPLTRELQYFIDNLGKKIKVSGGESGLEVVRVLEKAQKSLLGRDEKSE